MAEASSRTLCETQAVEFRVERQRRPRRLEKAFRRCRIVTTAGPVRYAWFDAALARYARKAIGTLDALMVEGTVIRQLGALIGRPLLSHSGRPSSCKFHAVLR